MKNITLYHMEGCPYCQKVFNYLKQAGINIATKSTSADPANRQELLKIGGKTQVPCLVINGKALYESDDIIAWFKSNWKK